MPAASHPGYDPHATRPRRSRRRTSLSARAVDAPGPAGLGQATRPSRWGASGPRRATTSRSWRSRRGREPQRDVEPGDGGDAHPRRLTRGGARLGSRPRCSPAAPRCSTSTITNTAGGTLDFAIPQPLVIAATGGPAREFTPIAKGEARRAAGDPVLEGNGGPDAYGYRWSDSHQPGGPVFSWIDITTIGTSIPLTSDDGTSPRIPLGMAFPFYGPHARQRASDQRFPHPRRYRGGRVQATSPSRARSAGSRT